MSVQRKVPKIKIIKSKANKPDESLVFIDASYFCFYRFTATKAWYTKFTKKGTDQDCNLQNVEFKKAYIDQFIATIDKIKSKFKTNLIYWFADAPQDTLWRLEHSPNYKQHRPKCDISICESFAYAFQHIIPSDKIIKVDTAEADDCLGISVIYELNKNPSKIISVISGDTDYLQLQSGNVNVYGIKSNLKMLDIKVKIGKEYVLMDNLTYLKTKILMGDKTDGISPIFKGCSPAVAYKYATNDDLFKNDIENNDVYWKAYLHNQQMIDFKYVPSEIQQEICTKYNNVISNNKK